MHRPNLDLVAFLHHCVEPAEFGQQNTIGDVEMGAGLELPQESVQVPSRESVVRTACCTYVVV